ncbi:molybdopterin-guanine dinucleotide biosynthesis protein B [Planococcus sp. PAMC 21323]|uniref:molybdopterin-guanine dinucleotide biosynthesis protein B n=1 Tax=Planococcus sp. PAMC 21323 TaxID=1526927 RepID=UPI00056FA639|nr:molybdopterin-guanine dinucleotide biosynthesis protein B [Planococcus sp. PAMC 21323]AIY05523.1 molybdopterin-guanine dinucleotide biosynthesis protein B [Planococcus sp. PAMC 21323]
MKVLQIVGYKNSGKTTLILQLLKLAKSRGKKVSTIKHHGHGGALHMPDAKTDSMRQFEEGADCSIAYGGGVIQMHQQKQNATLDDLILLSAVSNPDLVLVEGFKESHYAKIVLLHSEEDWVTLQKLKHIELVVSPEALELDKAYVNLQNDSKQIGDWFINWMDGDNHEGL